MKITVATYPLTQLVHKNAALNIETSCSEMEREKLPVDLIQVIPQRKGRAAWFISPNQPVDVIASSPSTRMQLTLIYYMQFMDVENENTPAKKLQMVLREVPYDGKTKFTSEDEPQAFMSDMIPGVIQLWSELSEGMTRITEYSKSIEDHLRKRRNKKKPSGTLLN